LQAVLENLAPLPRDQWVRCAFPKHAVEAGEFGEFAEFQTTNGRNLVAVKGRTIRDHSVIYRILGKFDGSERLEGQLVNPPPPHDAFTFAPHPWCADDVGELIPSVLVRKDGVDYETGPATTLKLVDASPAHQRFFLRKQIAELGMVFEWIAEIRHLDPVIECWGKLVWSDRNDPQEAMRVDGIMLKSGELFVDYFQKAKGMGAAFAAGRDWFIPVSGPRNFADTTGIDFSGQMLCFVSNPDTVPVDLDLETDNGWIAWSIRSLYAAGSGWPSVGCGVGQWDGHLLATKNEPRFRDLAELRNDFARDWGRFVDKLEAGGDFYDARQFGCSKRPGNTGDQEDFAAVKGTYALVAQEPKALHMLAYAVYADVYRPGAGFYEPDANGVLVPVDAAAHPQWWIWSDYTHYHPSVSRDRMGKTASSFGWPNIFATTFHGYDDQHRSQNNLLAVLGLFDDPLAENLVQMRSVPEQKMLLNRVGAPRAVGRLSGAWAHYVTLLDDGPERDRFMARVDEKLTVVGASSSLTVPGPVKIIAYGGPDLRRAVYYPPGHPEAGELAASWVPWEHGLYAVGTYNLYKATGDARALEQLKTVCATVVDWGLFQQAGEWFLCDTLVWLADGAGLDRQFIAYDPANPKPAVQVDPGITGVTSWGFCAVLIATEVLDPGPLLDKAKAAVRHFTGGRETTSRRTAEWWACVRSVNP
jgi:hypothetical protein